MSTGFDILFSPGDAFTSEPIKVYLQILKRVLNFPGVRRPEVDLTIYRRQRPFDYGSGSKDPHIVFDGTVHEEKAFEEIARLIDVDERENRDVYVGVTCGYDLLHWDNETCDFEETTGPFALEYESPEFDGGHAFKMRGPYRIHFYDNKRIFSLRKPYIHLMKSFVENRIGANEFERRYLSMFKSDTNSWTEEEYESLNNLFA